MSIFEERQGDGDAVLSPEEEKGLVFKKFVKDHKVVIVLPDGSIDNSGWKVSETPHSADENIRVYRIADPNKPHHVETKLVPKDRLKFAHELDDSPDFTQAKSLEELYSMINEMSGKLQGSGQEYTPKILMEIIEKVRLSELETTFITNTGGLRDTFVRLTNQENLQEKKA